MQELPRISSYGKYGSDNYGAHTLRVTIDNLQLYFSYETIVAFGTSWNLKVSENCWGPTTGKHLNWIDGGEKGSRLPREEFETQLNDLLAKHGLREAV